MALVNKNHWCKFILSHKCTAVEPSLHTDTGKQTCGSKEERTAEAAPGPQGGEEWVQDAKVTEAEAGNPREMFLGLTQRGRSTQQAVQDLLMCLSFHILDPCIWRHHKFLPFLHWTRRDLRPESKTRVTSLKLD